MEKKIFFSYIALLGLLGGCASPPTTTQTTPVEEAPAATPSLVTEPLVPATPISKEILYMIMAAEVAGQRGQITTAVENYMAAARLSRDPRVIERATRIAVYARDNTHALEAARMWVELEPTSVEAHQVAAAMYVRIGNTELAQHHLEQVINLNVQGEEKGFMLVSALLSKERDKQTALSVMEELVADRQDNAAALYAYSQLALLVGELEKARLTADQVRKLRPEWTEAHILYSNILLRQGQKSQAIHEISKTVEDYPDNSTLRHYYARILVDDKKYKEARQQFRYLLDDDPQHVEALYALGLLSMQLRDYVSSEDYFRQLLKLEKRTDEASFYLGQIAETKGDNDDAIRWYSSVYEGQYTIDAQVRVAVLEARNGNIEEAREHLHSIHIDSAEVELRIFMAEGEILREAKRYQDAFDVYSVALAQIPGNVQLLYARALTAEKIERLDVTLQDLEKVLAREPENAQALNAYGYTLVDRTDRLKEGMEYIQKAYNISSDDPAILDSMGWAHYRLGNYDEAIEYLTRAFDKMRDGEIAAHLGEVLWVTGDREAARTVWDEALKETPTHELLLDVIKRFTE